jgi:hypothetical protein
MLQFCQQQATLSRRSQHLTGFFLPKRCRIATVCPKKRRTADPAQIPPDRQIALQSRA